MAGDEPGPDDEVLDLTAQADNIDFDISDTVAPAFETDDGADDDLLDITTTTPEGSADDVLDFDIGGLGDDDETAEFDVSAAGETAGFARCRHR